MIRFVDEQPWGFGWVMPERLQRTSHAIRAGAGVWLVDPVAAGGVDERIQALGKPAGVIQLLDRHGRDAEAFAQRFGVPHYVVPLGRIESAPFEFLLVRKGRFWREVALWWEAERVLCVADAFGTVPGYFLASGDALGVHPLLRAIPPRKRLGHVAPRHILVGHGAGLHGDAAERAFAEALSSARRRAPRLLAGLVRSAASRVGGRRRTPRP
jgi:hypothetical protein